MHELSLLSAANEHPERDCLIAEGKTLSYAEVAARVDVALQRLRDCGLARGDRVALTPSVDVDSIVWLYALFEMGAPAVLLHPGLADRERALILRCASPAHVIDDRVPEDRPGHSSDSMDSPSPSDTLTVIYTSGSAGAARGACLSRRAFVASAAAHAAHLGWRDDDRWLLCMPPAHVGGLSVLTRCLIARRCVVLGPPAFEPREVLHILRRDRVTLCSLVPTMLRRLLACEPAWSPHPELRAVLVGGAHFPQALRKRSVEHGIPTLATYGCTEACSQVTTQSPAQAGTLGSGTPLSGIDVRIDDGEIQIRGPVLMDGYLEEDRAHAWQTTDGWLRTGDAGSWLDDGQLLVHGRLDDLIVTGGENVVPREVEDWLQSIPGIESASVFSVPSKEWGEEVVAALVVVPRAYDPGALRDALRAGLAPHKRPKRVCVVEALPLNRTGKVDRALVRSQCVGRLQPI